MRRRWFEEEKGYKGFLAIVSVMIARGSEPPLPFRLQNKSLKEKPSDPVEWTVSDVVDYFTGAGFAEQASAFQEQEIDGKSLLLMQRTDVLTGLSIRLGPALKIYEYHIKVLQQAKSSLSSVILPI
uniref:SAM domain-containing protein n=1 Tax=Laticauda laticaudata TaxID=8630 RepID=A0A8C5S3F1_LATLA